VKDNVEEQQVCKWAGRADKRSERVKAGHNLVEAGFDGMQRHFKLPP
jgi:hypothetical protein